MKTSFTFLFIFQFLAPGIHAQLIIPQSTDATLMAKVISSYGAELTGASGELTGYYGSDPAGIFSAEGTTLGLDSGILLTTGSALHATGPNYNSLSSAT